MEIRKMINKVKQLNEAARKLKPVAVYTSEIMLDNFLDDHNLNDYTYVINEYEAYHMYCPLGFDLTVDKVNKKIVLDIFLQNEPPSNRVFWQTVEEELTQTFQSEEQNNDKDQLSY